MEKLIAAGMDPRILEITETVWSSINFGSLKLDDDLFFDIDKFELSVGNTKINQLKIIKSKSAFVHLEPKPFDNKEGFYIKIECADNGTFAHEISHLLFKCKNHISPKSSYLTNYIKERCKKEKKQESIVEYFKLQSLTDFDRVIVYLYLADRDEMMAKLAGFYFYIKLNNNGIIKLDDYTKGVIAIYNEMRNWNLNVQQIEKADSVNNIIVNYLKDVPNALTIQTLPKYFKDQAEDFFRKYDILFN